MLKIGKKNNIQVHHILLVLAAACFIFALCVNAIELRQGIKYFGYVQFSDVFYSFYEEFVLLFLVTIVLICSHKTVTIPIVITAYLVYLAWTILDILLDSYMDEHIYIIFLSSIVCAIIAGVIWMIKPATFRLFAFLYAPLSVAMIYYMIAMDLVLLFLPFYIGESLLYLSLVFKCVCSEDSNKMLINRTHVYSIIGVVLVVIDIIINIFMKYS